MFRAGAAVVLMRSCKKKKNTTTLEEDIERISFTAACLVLFLQKSNTSSFMAAVCGRDKEVGS